MCVGFWSLDHPQYALILCSNRDEYLSRPTANAHFHSFGNINDSPDGPRAVLSGRDLLAGGTWAGTSRTGRIALLTNITEPPGKYRTSRGILTSSFLLPSSPGADLQAEVEGIVSRNAHVAGFNLLLLAPKRTADDRSADTLSFDAAFVTNSGGGGTISARPLSDQERHRGGISNGIDQHGASDWPKVKRGTCLFNDMLESTPGDAGELDLAERLFELLTWKSDRAPPDRAELRNTIQVEPLLLPAGESADTPSRQYYGTRLSTVMLVRRDGAVLFIERDIWTLDSEGQLTKGDVNGQRVFRFRIGGDTAIR